MMLVLASRAVIAAVTARDQRNTFPDLTLKLFIAAFIAIWNKNFFLIIRYGITYCTQQATVAYKIYSLS